MNEPIFTSLSSNRIAERILQAKGRVFLAVPGISKPVAEALLEFKRRHASPVIVLDCDDEVCRIGYGEIEAVKRLIDGGVAIRQCSGLRIGVLICDDSAWSFAPTPLSVEEEPETERTPNAIRLSQAEVITLLQAAAPSLVPPSSLFELPTTPADSQDREIGAVLLKSADVKAVEECLEYAPPIRFDLQRQVRVFQPYIQYVELSLTGCSISRHTVQIPKEMVGLAADKAVQERLRTTFNLISQNSNLSDKPLQEELEEIRKTYTRSLGKEWGRVILRNQRDNIDRRVKALSEKVNKFGETIKENLNKEIEKSVDQLATAFLPLVMGQPPEDLLGQIPTAHPTRDQAEQWLRYILRRAFPTVEQVVSVMKLECVYKDVTYENLTHPGLKEALQREYPAVHWDKLFQEFDAVSEKQNEQSA